MPPHRLAVRTPCLHQGDTGSYPVGRLCLWQRSANLSTWIVYKSRKSSHDRRVPRKKPPDPIVNLGLRVTPEIKAALNDIAESDGRTMCGLGSLVITRWVEAKLARTARLDTAIEKLKGES